MSKQIQYKVQFIERDNGLPEFSRNVPEAFGTAKAAREAVHAQGARALKYRVVKLTTTVTPVGKPFTPSR